MSQPLLDKAPWQHVTMCLSYGDSTYFPAYLTDLPSSLREVDEQNMGEMRLLMAVSVCGGDCVPEDVRALLERSCLGQWLDGAESWLEVPILAADLQDSALSARIFPVLLGKTQSPDIVIESGWLAPEAEEAARKALGLGGCGQCGFRLLPRFDPASLKFRIDGPSLSLPLAVAALRLRKDKPSLKSFVAMTGALDDKGAVLRVSYTEEKLEAVRTNEHPAQFFLYPACCPCAVQDEGTIALPVDDFRQADALLDMCGSAEATTEDFARRLTAWRKDPTGFVSWLEGGNWSEQMLQPLLSLAKDQNWFGGLGDTQLAKAIHGMERTFVTIGKKLPLEIEGTVRKLLLDFFPDSRLQKLVDEAEDCASPGLFSLIQGKITRLNHQGKDSSALNELGQRCYNALPPDEQTQCLLGPDIRGKINQYHNRYRFYAEDVSREIQAIEAFPSSFHSPEIGKIYGFLTQHMAFCGEYDRARTYAARSLDNFPVPKDKSWRYVDLAFIALEEQLTDEARQHLRQAFIMDRELRRLPVTGKKSAALLLNTLCSLLGLKKNALTSADLALAVDNAQNEEAHTLFARLCQALDMDYDSFVPERSMEKSKNPYIHAAYARLMCMCGQKDKESYVRHTLAQAEQRHPWQLWANNCGRLVAGKNPKLALECLKFSLNVCLGDPEQRTMHPMALLPLGTMYAFNLVPLECITQQAEKVMVLIRQHCEEGQLDTAHFTPLLSLQAAEVLQEVNSHAKMYFPFEYR